MAKPAAPPYFFYGTLMDPDVLSWVAGQRIPATRLRPAWIDGHVTRTVLGKTCPVLVEAADEVTGGRYVAGLGLEAADRIHRFGDDGHDLVMKSIRLPGGGRREAMVYLGTEWMEISDEVWDFRTWRRHHRASCLRRVRRWSASA